METISTEIDIKIIENTETQMQDAIYHFENLNRPRKDIKIYMPEYFNRMFSYHKVMHPQHGKMTNYHGIDIVDGYENKVVISVKNNVIYNIEPIRIEIK